MGVNMNTGKDCGIRRKEASGFEISEDQPLLFLRPFPGTADDWRSLS